MPRKARTPPPPRRVQAPQQRSEPRDRRGPALLIAAALVLVLVAVGAYLALRGGESENESVQAAMEQAGCTFRTVEASAAGTHITDPEARPEEWTTYPPTNGPHYGQWVIWGEYDEPVRLAEAVHNLEHGGIVMYYGEDVPQEEVQALRRFYRSDPVGMLLAPLPDLDDKIALTAWHSPDPQGDIAGAQGEGILAECTRFDEDAFETFRDEYRFEGPERIPPENLQPGS